MPNPVIETVLFKLEPGVKSENFEATLPDSLAFMKSCKGWQARRLSCSDDGQWIEHVQWATMEDAKTAASKIGESELTKEFVSMIHGPSVKMYHTHLRMAEDA